MQSENMSMHTMGTAGAGPRQGSDSSLHLPCALGSNQHRLMLLQIASCSMHRSGALLLEAQDGEFLDEHLCSSSASASTQMQYGGQPTANEEAQQSVNIGQGNDMGQHDIHNDFDDGGDDFGGGDEYMHQTTPGDLQGRLFHAALLMPGQYCSVQCSAAAHQASLCIQLDPPYCRSWHVCLFASNRRSASTLYHVTDLPAMRQLLLWTCAATLLVKGHSTLIELKWSRPLLHLSNMQAHTLASRFGCIVLQFLMPLCRAR